MPPPPWFPSNHGDSNPYYRGPYHNGMSQNWNYWNSQNFHDSTNYSGFDPSGRGFIFYGRDDSQSSQDTGFMNYGPYPPRWAPWQPYPSDFNLTPYMIFTPGGRLPQRHRRLSRPAESVVVDSLDADQRTCLICYEDFGVSSPETGESEQPIKLPCGHIVGANCFDVWLQAGAEEGVRFDWLGNVLDGAERQPWRKCPICRKDLEVIEE